MCLKKKQELKIRIKSTHFFKHNWQGCQSLELFFTFLK